MRSWKFSTAIRPAPTPCYISNRHQRIAGLHGADAASAALAERERQAAQVLENALDVYVAIDDSDRIVEWNRQATTLFGWSAHEAIGRRLTDTIIPPDMRERHLAALRTFATRTEHALLGERLEIAAAMAARSSSSCRSC